MAALRAPVNIVTDTIILVFTSMLIKGMQMEHADTIKVWTDDAGELERKSALPTLARNAVARTVEFSAETLRASVEGFAAQFAPLVDDKPLQGTNVVIDEIELSLTVSASGGIELLGKMNASAQAAIKVKLKRRK